MSLKARLPVTPGCQPGPCQIFHLQRHFWVGRMRRLSCYLWFDVQLLQKASIAQLSINASPAEHLRVALQQVLASNPCARPCLMYVSPAFVVNMRTLLQGAEISIKELDQLLILLAERKRKAEQEEAECNMEMLLDFLDRSLQQKQEELSEVLLILQVGQS